MRNETDWSVQTNMRIVQKKPRRKEKSGLPQITLQYSSFLTSDFYRTCDFWTFVIIFNEFLICLQDFFI